MMPSKPLGLVVAAALLLLAACVTTPGPGPGPGSGCSTVGAGQLTLTITAPPGVPPSVQVRGPNGYDQTFTASQTLSLPAGSYTVQVMRAAFAPGAGELVGSAYGALSGTVQVACVKDGDTVTVTVDYALQPASGKLWVAQGLGYSILGFGNAKLTSASAAAADIRLDFSSGFDNFRGLAFDAMGNLWVARFNPEAVIALTPDQLAASGAPTPALVLQSSAFEGPWGIAFDAMGNLWVGDWFRNTLVMYSAASVAELLVAGGTQNRAPDHVLAASGFDDPEGIAFDAMGNLWVSADDPLASNDLLLRFDAADLTSSSPTPALKLTSTSFYMIGAGWPAFDAAGNLYFTPGSSLAMIPASLLTGSGSSVIDFTQPGTFYSANMEQPRGIAFDADGKVWIANFEQELRRYTPGENNTGLSWNTSSDLSYPQGLAFYPSPLNGILPLR